MRADIRIERVGAEFTRWQELLDLILASFSCMDGVIDPPSSAHRLTPEVLREKARTEVGLVALDSETLLGCAFIAERADHIYLSKLAVLPAHQGRGIGRALMAAADELARKHDKPIELQTRVELTDNHAAFAKLGFRETGRTAHPGFDRPTSVTMRKEFS